MDDSIRKRLRSIEAAICDQVAVTIGLSMQEKGAAVVDLRELCRQRRQLQKLLVGGSEAGKAA